MKHCILFVDDDPTLLAGLQRMLQDSQAVWDMSFASSADEALSRMRSTTFDVVVADVCMPGKDGFSLMKEMQHTERLKDIPVIILTGSHEGDMKRKALELGAVDLLTKPVHPEDLTARLRSALRLKRYEDELRNHNAVLEKRIEERTAELADLQLEIIWRLAKAAEHRDEETGNHVVRVACYCYAMAEGLGLDRGFARMLFLASPLHDIGKIGIPDHILLKRGPLEPQEWEVMKRHCVVGSGILSEDPKAVQAYFGWCRDRGLGRDRRLPNPILRMASTIAMTHHERWDGSGYPASLAGDQIPLESRIVALADVYDAVRSERPYKRAFSEEEAVNIIRSERGLHFDPKVCDAFESLIGEFRAIGSEFADEPCGSAELVGAS